MWAIVLGAVLVSPANAVDLRVALWHAPFTSDGPGLLLRDVVQHAAPYPGLATEIARMDADVVVLTRFDYDASGDTLRAFAALIDRGYVFTQPLRSNAGVPTGMDMDGDGRLGEPEDMQAYGHFPGQEALAVLSKWPIDVQAMRHFNDLLWADAPDGLMSAQDPGQTTQKLSSGGHWVVPIEMSVQGQTHRIAILIGHADPPVFDGPEDRNGRRNRDELLLWDRIIAGTEHPYIWMGNTNLDPHRGEGYRQAMAGFLRGQNRYDPLAGQVTAHWDTPGPMRVSYILPSTDFDVTAAQVHPALEGQHHSMITLDVTIGAASLP